jgi:hypothetical protein
MKSVERDMSSIIVSILESSEIKLITIIGTRMMARATMASLARSRMSHRALIFGLPKRHGITAARQPA